MPNPSHSGITGSPWHNCDRCGLSYRIAELTWQDGWLLCVRTCWDQQTARQRDIQLARAITEATLYPDAQIDPKLTQPNVGDPNGE